MRLSELVLPGPAACAVAIGHDELVKTGSAVARFEVTVVTHADAFEVIFIPEQDPGQETLGGRTSAGRETHYWIASADLRLLRTTYGR